MSDFLVMGLLLSSVEAFMNASRAELLALSEAREFSPRHKSDGALRLPLRTFTRSM